MDKKKKINVGKELEPPNNMPDETCLENEGPLENDSTNPTTPSELLAQEGEQLKGLFDQEETKQFGRYQIIEELGHGGMGKVYKAYDPDLERAIALKIILLEEKEEVAQRFLVEAKAAANLSHNNIAKIFDIGQEAKQLFFTMEYLEGKPLSHWIKKEKLALEKIICITKKLAQALAYTHSKGVIHRDLKPANIMMVDGEPYIIDFGLAKYAHSSSDLTKEGAFLGTPYYMSPEQTSGEINEIDSQSDIYSLGVVLYEMLTGTVPFKNNNRVALLVSIAKDKPKSPASINSSIPCSLENICLKAMQKNKSKRFNSMKEFSLALSELETKKTSSNNRPLVIAITCLIVVIVVVAFIATKNSSQLQYTVNKEVNKVIDVSQKNPFVEKENVDFDRLKMATPHASDMILVRKLGNKNKKWQILEDGQKLSSEYEYHIRFLLDRKAYCYVFQIDAKGKVYWIFPKNPAALDFSGGKNPVAPGTWQSVPKSSFILDETVGIEHIYVIFAVKRWHALEEALYKAAMSKKSTAKVIRYVKEKGLERGIGKKTALPKDVKITQKQATKGLANMVQESKYGVLVRARWFYHVARSKK